MPYPALALCFFCSFAALNNAMATVEETTSEAEERNLKTRFNQTTLMKIKQKIQEGGKACLIIGRGVHEELPPQENPEDFWVSGDTLALSGDVSGTRLHIWGNFSDDALLAPFNGLFSKVVVDISTWKFFIDDHISDPGKRFAKLLQKGPSSTFIFEAMLQTNPAIDQPEPIYKTYSYSVPKAWNGSPLESNYMQAFKQFSPEGQQHAREEVGRYMTQRDGFKMPADEVHVSDYARYKLETEHPEELERLRQLEVQAEETSRQKILAHLRTFFRNVELVQQGSYYLPFANYKGPHDYYVCKDPM